MIAGLDALPTNRVTSVQTINRYVARILTQWRESQAAGPLWFGRNRRAEAVILPCDLAHAVADAAVDGVDLARSSELQLRNISARFSPNELSSLAGADTLPSLTYALCKAAALELVALQEANPELLAALAGHLTQGAEGAVETKIGDITRRIAHTDAATWITYWSSPDRALLAVVPAPLWLRRLVTEGPQEAEPSS